VQIDLRAKDTVILSHQLAYAGIPFDSSDMRMNYPGHRAVRPLAVSHRVFPLLATNN
jgi:hypothetical protein